MSSASSTASSKVSLNPIPHCMSIHFVIFSLPLLRFFIDIPNQNSTSCHLYLWLLQLQSRTDILNNSSFESMIVSLNLLSCAKPLIHFSRLLFRLFPPIVLGFLHTTLSSTLLFRYQQCLNPHFCPSHFLHSCCLFMAMHVLFWHFVDTNSKPCSNGSDTVFLNR